MRPSNYLENTSLSAMYKRFQLVCMKVQVHSSLEPPLKHNEDQAHLMNQGSLWPFKPSWELQKYYAVSD